MNLTNIPIPKVYCSRRGFSSDSNIYEYPDIPSPAGGDGITTLTQCDVFDKVFQTREFQADLITALTFVDSLEPDPDESVVSALVEGYCITLAPFQFVTSRKSIGGIRYATHVGWVMSHGYEVPAYGWDPGYADEAFIAKVYGSLTDSLIELRIWIQRQQLDNTLVGAVESAQCPKCEGTGYKDHLVDDSESCPTCGGSGWRPEPKENLDTLVLAATQYTHDRSNG